MRQRKMSLSTGCGRQVGVVTVWSAVVGCAAAVVRPAGAVRSAVSPRAVPPLRPRWRSHPPPRLLHSRLHTGRIADVKLPSRRARPRQPRLCARWGVGGASGRARRGTWKGHEGAARVTRSQSIRLRQRWACLADRRLGWHLAPENAQKTWEERRNCGGRQVSWLVVMLVLQQLRVAASCSLDQQRCTAAQ